ncbi:MAG: hypothetical protein AB1529_01675 [Candidatus Micrarchaeota archaeon]
MIGTINSIVSKVVGTVSGPIYSWGGKSVKPKSVKKVRKAKCSHKKCKCC